MADQGVLPRPLTLDVRECALFLDLDGTLAPIAERPEDVGPNKARSGLLRALSEQMQGRLAVISGRTIAEIDRILDGVVTSLAGVHGLEHRWPDGRIERGEPDPGLDAARRDIVEIAARFPNILIEDKGLALAVHYRARPDAAEAVLDEAQRISAATGLVIQRGEMVVELRGPGARKGDAVAAFMRVAPFAGKRPVFAGDDLTDEDGFSTVHLLGGEGVLVGPPRATAATARLDDVSSVLAWLSAAIEGGVNA